MAPFILNVAFYFFKIHKVVPIQVGRTHISARKTTFPPDHVPFVPPIPVLSRRACAPAALPRETGHTYILSTCPETFFSLDYSISAKQQSKFAFAFQIIYLLIFIPYPSERSLTTSLAGNSFVSTCFKQSNVFNFVPESACSFIYDRGNDIASGHTYPVSRGRGDGPS
uniref:Secreted protein n=1 Tax=Panagrellus redivivus TaxID=6233 RepID=A0A7E4UUQ9_PANRE